VEVEVLAQVVAQGAADFQVVQEALILVLIRAVEEIVAEHSAAPRIPPARDDTQRTKDLPAAADGD
jgi:hypothetical protein